MKKHLKKLWSSQRGFTLAEMIVGVGILSIIMGTIGTSLFQALGTQREVADDGLAINEIRNGLSWFAEDVKRARDADVTSGVLTLTWTDEFGGDGTNHTVTYELVGDSLVRTYDGSNHTVAHRVVSVAFTLSSRTITAQLEVNAEPGTTRTLSMKTVMRSTPS